MNIKKGLPLYIVFQFNLICLTWHTNHNARRSFQTYCIAKEELSKQQKTTKFGGLFRDYYSAKATFDYIAWSEILITIKTENNYLVV